MAGEPLVDTDERYKILELLDESVLDNAELNRTTVAAYESSAEEFSGNYTNRGKIITIIGIVCVCAILAAVLGMYAWKRHQQGNTPRKEVITSQRVAIFQNQWTSLL